jgi:aminocarboxymuconate-semialdehyde decarboxylase
MRKIDAFAHILPAGYLEHLERHLASTMRPAQLRYYQEGVFRFDPVISDLGARLRMMDRHGDYAQVLVLAVPPLEEVDPPEAASDLARRANDEMADLARRFPERFAGFAAALPLGDTEASLTEIDHAVGELGALGVQLFTNVRGAPLDDPRFDPILARVEELDRMVWLHPTRSAAWPDYATERESNFGIWWSLGWPYETAAALSRLVYSGQMERHPRLRVIAHHGGGMVPHFSSRLAMGPGYRQTKESLPLRPLD